MTHFVYIKKPEPVVEKAMTQKSGLVCALIVAAVPLGLMVGIMAITTVLTAPFAWLIGLL